MQNPARELELGFPIRDRTNGGFSFSLPSMPGRRW